MPSQANEMNPNAGIAAVPIRAVPPTKKSAKIWERKAKFSKCKTNPFASEIHKPKQCKKKPSAPKNPNSRANVENGGLNDDVTFDISRVPPPVCSCSGLARRCYRAGPGGWQSSCCTNSFSEYPLPLSPTKPGKRVTGRKMNNGVYRKVLCRLAAEGYDLSRPVDLKNHWAKHGTNKFVTIK